MKNPSGSNPIAVPLDSGKEENKSAGNSIHDFNGQPSQQQMHSSSPGGNSQLVQKTIHTIHNSRRPIKKRMRPQLFSDQHKHEQISPPVATKSIMHPQPEPFQEDQPLPGRSEKIRLFNKASSLSEHDQDLASYDTDSDSFAMSVEDGPIAESVPVVVTPPHLHRCEATYFPLTQKHLILVEDRSAQAQKTSHHNYLALSSYGRETMPAFLFSLQGAGADIVPKKLFFAECFEGDSEGDDESFIGEEALRQMYTAVRDRITGLDGNSIQPPQPPQLAKTESDSMCIMMKDLFEPSSRSTSMGSAVVPASVNKATKRGFTIHASRKKTQEENSVDIMEGAFSTMQQEMIATPKRSFRFKGNSFSSFASSASGSSRSSCVTPSPAKRMMTSAFNRGIEMPDPPFGHRPSRSMGSLEGTSATSTRGEGYKASAPHFPELADSVKALTRVSKQYWLTDQQKIDRVKPFISVPPKLKPKLPPRHVGRTLSGVKSHRNEGKGQSDGRFGSKRLLSEEAKREMKTPPGEDCTTGMAIECTLEQEPHPKGEFETTMPQLSQKEQNQQRSCEKSDYHESVARTSRPPSPGFGSNSPSYGVTVLSGSRISWVEHQQQMFNPHEISSPPNASVGSDNKTVNPSNHPSEGKASQKKPRRISQF